jgi:hypothetical protein
MAELSEDRAKVGDMNVLIMPDPIDQHRRLQGLIATLDKQLRIPEQALVQAKEKLGANLDHEHVHQKLDEPLHVNGDVARKTRLALRTADRRWDLGIGVGIGAEHEVAHGKPHLVMPTDLLLRQTALVQSVRLQEPPIQMPHRHPANVLVNDFGEVGRLDSGQRPTARLDDPGNRQGIPEGLAEPMTEQVFLLGKRRESLPGKKRGIEGQQVAAALAQALLPGAHGFPANGGSGREVPAG